MTVLCVFTIEYSDEGEELPLGPSFQRLIKLYIELVHSHTIC